jgi:type IV pilus assembly protein PilM
MESPLDATAYVPLQDSISAGLSSPVFRDRAAVAAALKSALDSVSPNGRDWTLILPDACTRVLLLDFDTLPAKPQEVLPLVRFRLRRMIPFDADTAAVSYQLLKPAGTANGGAVQVIAAAMPGEVREEIESLMRESEREPGTLLPATLAALAAVPETGSHLLVHTGEHSITTAITRNGELRLYRRTEHSEVEPGEMAQAILVAAAYYEDTLHTTLEEVWVAGFETPEMLRVHLEQDGEWRIPLRSLITSEAFSAAAAPAHVAASRYTSVVGALRG